MPLMCRHHCRHGRIVYRHGTSLGRALAGRALVLGVGLECAAWALHSTGIDVSRIVAAGLVLVVVGILGLWGRG